MAERPFIYRFTDDLRLDDHAGLAAAASRGPVIPLIVIDNAMRERISASPRRGEFFCAAVTALSDELEQRGSRLIVRRGEPEIILPHIARETGASGVAWSASYDRGGVERDRRAASVLEEAGWRALVEHDAPIISPEESAAAHSAGGSGYRAFAPYFDAWLKVPVPSHEYPLLLRLLRPDTENEPLPAGHEFGASATGTEAGAAVARRRFDRFLREGAAWYALAATAPADDRTSHLSADLSFGTIAARTIARAVRDRLDDPFALSEERLSLRLFLRALAHRDFFMQLGWFYPQAQEEPLQEKMRGFTWESSHGALDAWREGMTGYPLVDAGVRQLHATGWMHPHVRAVAASFLCFDLGVHWRIGRDEWDRWLVEDDPSLAAGNWQWIAGVGADMAQYPRIYNPERQRRRYDPAGTYVRRWVPELRDVPLDAWYERPSNSPQLALGLYDAAAYPGATIDHGVAARAFLRRYREFSRRPR
jgi:deoxyribodipyrimidine photo-lyase